MLKSLNYIHIKNRVIIFIICCLLFNFFATVQVLAQNPIIPKYDAVKRSERCFSITPEAKNQFGALWWADKVDFSNDTLFNFVICMGNNDGGSQGLAFVMHQDPNDTITPENYVIQPSVAIELDTYNNGDVPDGTAGMDGNMVNQPTSPYLGWDHTSVIYNGDLNSGQQMITDGQGNSDRILPLKPSYAFGTVNNADGSPYHNIEDDGCYLYQIRWEVNADGTQNLQLWGGVYDGTTNTNNLFLIMTHTDDMIDNVFGGSTVMRFGFTGSTGLKYNEQTVCALEDNNKPIALDDIVSMPLNTTAVIDVGANDTDPDGDQLYVPIIVDPARNGMVTIFDSLNISYLQYTPYTNYTGYDTVAYVTCDANSIQGYAKCDTSYVYISVNCTPFDIEASPISPNTVCSDLVPSNGAGSALAYLNRSIWYEGFEDLDAGDIVDNGATGWTFAKSGGCTSNGDQVRVDTENGGQKFRVQNSGCEIEWITDEIDIAPYTKGVDVSLNFNSTGTFENDDYIKVYYKVDGGPLQEFYNGIHFGSVEGGEIAFVDNVIGDKIQIVILVKNNNGNEQYFWDNLNLKAETPTVAGVTFNWHYGPDVSTPSVYTGAVANGITDGLYTVIAVDQESGCLSNPTNVTIDSAGFNVPGGYIEQIAPFTNCKLPYDGALEAGLINGPDTVTVGYTFDWYYQEDPKTSFFLQSTGAAFSNLESREYTVIITETASGCDTTINENVISSVIIPTVTATKLADVISCSDPNTGSGEASVVGITNGYNFEWYIGPAIGAGPPDFTTPTVNTFSPGIYTVHAIDTGTACASESRSFTISDLSVLPNVQISVDSEQTSCDTLALTGEFSGTVSEAGVPTTSGYTFNWYKGPNDIIPARNGYNGGPTVDSLDAGAYRLVVVQDITNCTSFVDTLIQDLTVTPPDITLTTVDVTACDISNGSININVIGNPANYTYDIYTGFGVVSDSLLLTSANINITGLSVGNYTVVAKDIITKCETNPATATINDATILPTATFTSQDQVSCDPGNPTGQISASVGTGIASDYTFEWFENDVAGASIAPSGVNGEVISGLDTGNYALRITRDATQCITVLYSSVNLGIVLPVEVVSAVPSTNCGTAANGQLLATVDGGLTEVDGYTFIWESVDYAITLAATTATVTSIEPGDYLLTVINDVTTCQSNPAPVTVGDNTFIPDPAFSIADNTSCDVSLPNGTIQVAGINNEANALSDYYYTWYDGNSAGAQLIAPMISYPNDPDSSYISGLGAGTVALVITNSITSCSNEVLSVINDVSVIANIDDVNVDHADYCTDPYMSGASIVSINGGLPVPVGYTFAWTNMDGGPMITGNGSIISDINLMDETLPAGNYQVIAYNEYNCPSTPYSFTLNDVSVAPTFSLSGSNNISCDVNNPSGSLLATRPDETYTISMYEWFQNNTSGALLSTTTPVDSILYSVDGGTYAVRITDALTGCTAVEYTSIQNVPSNVPIIQNISNIGITSCIVPDGELAYRVIPFENAPPLNLTPRNYTFYIEGVAAYNQSSAGTDNATFTGLSQGAWNAWVVDDFTHCQSDTITVTMADAPEITIIADAIKLPSSCAAVDGELDIYAETLTNNTLSGGTGFKFDWFRGPDGSQGAVVFSTTADNFSSGAVNLLSDYYFVAIEDLETGCTSDTAVYVPSITLPDFIGVDIDSSVRCAPFGDGAVSASLNNFTAGRGYSDYDFLLFEGPTFNTSWPADNTGLVHAVLAPAGGPVVVDNDMTPDLNPGVYTLVVKENFANCFSDPVLVQIDLDFTIPELTIDIVVDKSCNGAPFGTGQLEVQSTSPLMPLADFSFEWFAGATSVALGAQTPAILFANNYSVVGEITANVPGQGCVADSLISLPNILDTIQVVESVMANNNCAPFDGTIQFVDIEENGGSVGFADYTNFTVFDDDLPAIVPSIGDGIVVPWGEIAPGDYYLQAQNDITKCFTEIKQVSVVDVSQSPVISISLNNLDYGCTLGAATGELEAFSTAGNQNIADYNFTWHQGDVSSPVVSNLPLASNITAYSSTQLYTIEIEDILGANLGCVASRGYTLAHQPTTVSVSNPQMTIDPQTICGPNGSIVLNQINEDDGSGAVLTGPDYTGAYQAQLLDNNLNVIVPLANAYANFFPTSGAFGANDIPAGTYYVQASNIATGCAFGPMTQVIINDESTNPIISAVLDSPDYACAGGTSTGQLMPTAIGGSDTDNVQANFAINWFVKSSGAAVPGGPIASNLSPDVYTLEVVDMSGADLGCISSRDYEIISARHDLTISASAQDQTICIADGTAQVDAIVVDGGGIGLPNAGWNVLLLDENTTNISPGLPATGFAASPFANISAGKYYVQMQDDLTKCYSDPYQVVIEDLSEDPVIGVDVLVPQYSLNPNPASWTGSMQATVTELSSSAPDPLGYVYSWHAGIGDGNPSLSGLDNIDSLAVGFYTLKAVSNTSGCESEYTKYLPYQYVESIFNTFIAAQTVCSPNDGGIEVTDIALDGAPDMLSDYTFNWHHDTYAHGDVPDAVIPGNDVRTAYDNINSGSYYIIARENWWMIDSYPVQVEVIDSTTNPIINFDATNYQALTSCDQSVIANGGLAINVYEDNTNPNLIPPFNYTYTWYAGSEANAANIIPGETISTISGLTSGEYTVIVMNQANNCQSENTFTVEDESVIPLVAISQIPNTNCPVEIANGITGANVINTTTPHFYQWYEGTQSSGTPDYIGAYWSDRPVGSYTVVAIDQELGTCISEPVLILVEDATVHPTVVINELSPVTNCDPARPNGVLSALTGDGINGHTFSWHLDGEFHSSGPIASKLGLFTYSLVVSNDVTQCATTMLSGPSDLLDVVPTPDVDILNDRTSCLAPDGMASASVSGQVTDYIFRYYSNATEDQVTNRFEGNIIYGLDTTSYFVTAEDRNTGCISDRREFIISNESYFPEIDILVNPSSCLEPNGSANVIISDLTREYNVTWYGENGYEEQLKEIVYIPVGQYHVEVEGTDGCISSADTDVKVDVLIYNGVSANYDGLNDFFKVVCLEHFPDNNVRIYTRSGLLVYEQDFYDIHDPSSRFEGNSNSGINIIGTELPIGTYFYLVNKNDGSKPQVGYLELLRY